MKNPNKSTVIGLIISFMLGCPNAIWAAQLGGVEVIGEKPPGSNTGEWGGINFGPGGNVGDIGGPGTNNPGEGAGDGGGGPVAGTEVITQDVRCWEGSADHLTSLASAEARHGVAISIYRVHVAARKSLKVGEWFDVTWADGGSTSYQVLSNGPGALLAWGNEKESPSDGISKPGPVCGKG